MDIMKEIENVSGVDDEYNVHTERVEEKDKETTNVLHREKEEREKKTQTKDLEEKEREKGSERQRIQCTKESPA